MITRNFAIIILAFTVIALHAAQEQVSATSVDTTIVAAVPSARTTAVTQGEIIRAALTELKSDLLGSYGEYDGSDSKVVESFFAARARVEAALQFATTELPADEPPSLSLRNREKMGRELFVTCSLYVELALTQMATGRVTAEYALINNRRDSIATDLTGVYQSIINIERGRAADLKARLDAENEKTRKLQAEMAKRFRELESALVKVRRDARGTIVSMSDLLFAFDKADVTPELKTTLAKIAGILLVYKDCKIIVEGHTDNIGAAQYNQDLSQRRAVNVKSFLSQQGVANERMTSTGYGMTRPFASNTTKDGRQKNRRVDLVIIDK